jgi:hypothetical protein
MNKNPLILKSEQIDGVVLSVIGKKNITGFQKAHIVSGAIVQLKTLLDAEYMSPIMALQGTSLGFRTDKDKTGGYPVDVVQYCLIEAVLKGYQPTNNEFNIIAGNMYPTKNGLERKANEWQGLKYSIVQSIKVFSTENKNALVEALIKWEINGDSREETVPIPLKIDSWTSVDAVIGKGKRKALAWLLSVVSGEVVTDGDVDDLKLHEIAKPIESTINKPPMTPELLTKAIESIVFEGVDPENIKAEYDCTPDQIKQLDEAIPK